MAAVFLLAELQLDWCHCHFYPFHAMGMFIIRIEFSGMVAAGTITLFFKYICLSVQNNTASFSSFIQINRMQDKPSILLSTFQKSLLLPR